MTAHQHPLAAEQHPVVSAIIRAVVAQEIASHFSGRTVTDREDNDAFIAAIDAREAMLSQFRLMGLTDDHIGKMGALLL